DILRCFTPESPALANQSIAERTGLPKPTVSRLTHTLCELEYLSFSQRSGAYHLGPGVLALGYATIASLEMREHLRPYMETLADMANVTVALGARDRLDVIYLDVCRGRQTVTLSRNVGSRLPIAKTAIGRAILAALPEIEQRFLIEALQKDDPENAADLERTIRTARDEIDRQGFCTSLGDGQPDVNAVAAPIRSLDGEQVYGLNVSGPAFMVPRDLLLQELGPRLARVARHLGGPDMKHRENWGI
ncbi:MAG TPA: IclR family transcriptional regulator, partial [Thermohalobaculum sp.]|nr:IclR family transcriptional regulator [Thermohalobaculum sp.]